MVLLRKLSFCLSMYKACYLYCNCCVGVVSVSRINTAMLSENCGLRLRKAPHLLNTPTLADKHSYSKIIHMLNQSMYMQCKSPTPKLTSPNISDEGIYSLVFDALPNGTSQTVVSGKSNVL